MRERQKDALANPDDKDKVALAERVITPNGAQVIPNSKALVRKLWAMACGFTDGASRMDHRKVL